jgi:beta-galactosidase GanA
MGQHLVLWLLLGACVAESSASVIYYTPGQSHNITFDQRSPKINGAPTLLLSGAVHYTRVHEEEWGRVFDLAVEMGLNTIQTYVFWNAHETFASQVGNASWDGRANLPRFIDAAAARGLWVAVRIGPYICGEYYFGGIPVWMRESGAECFRCDDPIWEREMERWVKLVLQKIEPQIAPKGNVIMLQIENEYGGPAGSKGGDYPPGSDNAKYLGWAVDMARNQTTSVPWLLCHDVDQCTEINHGNNQPYNDTAYDYKALCAINGFWMDENDKDPHQVPSSAASATASYSPSLSPPSNPCQTPTTKHQPPTTSPRLHGLTRYRRGTQTSL